MEMDKPLQNNCCPYYKDLCEALNYFLHIQQNSKSLLFTAFFVSAFKCTIEQRLLFSSIVLILPLEEENGNDDADNEDHSQHRPHHPQKTLLLINNWLRIHI